MRYPGIGMQHPVRQKVPDGHGSVHPTTPHGWLVPVQTGGTHPPPAPPAPVVVVVVVVVVTPGLMVQSGSHPSLVTELPSSHCSPESTTPLPQRQSAGS